MEKDEDEEEEKDLISIGLIRVISVIRG